MNVQNRVSDLLRLIHTTDLVQRFRCMYGKSRSRRAADRRWRRVSCETLAERTATSSCTYSSASGLVDNIVSPNSTTFCLQSTPLSIHCVIMATSYHSANISCIRVNYCLLTPVLYPSFLQRRMPIAQGRFHLPLPYWYCGGKSPSPSFDGGSYPKLNLEQFEWCSSCIHHNDRAFAVAVSVPRVRNNLPDFITDCSSLCTFKHLNTYPIEFQLLGCKWIS